MSSVNLKIDVKSSEQFISAPVFTTSYCSRLWSNISSPAVLASGAVMGASALMGATLPVCAAIGAGFWIGEKLFKKVVSGGEALRPGVFLAAEHLSKSVEGGVPSLTIPPILAILRKMDSPNAGVALQCLENTLAYAENFDYSGLGNGPLVSSYQKLVGDLKPGELTALPCSVFYPISGHVMIASFACKVDGTFRVRIHNGGEGSNYHHKSKNSSVFQTAFEIDGVELPQILEFIADLAPLHAMRKNNSTQKLYKEIIPKLKGKILPASKDERLWGTGQTGNSCSGYSYNCFIKSILTPEEYKQFEARFLSHIIEQLVQGLESSYRFWEQSSDHIKALGILRAKQLALMPEEGLEFKQVPKEPSRLGKFSGQTNHLFWKLIFRPKEILSKQDDSRRIDYYKERVLANLNPRIQYLRDRLNLTLDPARFKVLIESLNTEIKKVDQEVNRSRLRSQEIKAMVHALQSYFEIAEKYINTKADDFEKESLAKAQQDLNIKAMCVENALFPHFKAQVSTPLAKQFLLSAQCLGQKNYEMCREHLTQAYQLPQEDGMLSTKEIGECLCALHELAIVNLNLNYSTTEEIELQAGLMLFLEMVAQRVSPDSKDYEVFKIGSEDLNHLINLNLESHIPESPWKELIGTRHQELKKQQTELMLSVSET